MDVPELLRDVLGRDRQATSDLAAAGGPVAGDLPDEATVAGVFDRLAGPEGLTAQASTFARQDLIAALGGHLAGANRARLEALADRFLSERAVSVVAERSLEERRWSTPELRAERDRIRVELDQAPPDRRRLVERTTQRRQQAEQDLAAIEAKHPGGTGRGTRDHDRDDAPVGVSIRPLHQLPDSPPSAPMLPAPGAGWERGGVAPAASGAPPERSASSSGSAGRCCTTWPSPIAAPTATTC